MATRLLDRDYLPAKLVNTVRTATQRSPLVAILFLITGSRYSTINGRLFGLDTGAPVFLQPQMMAEDDLYLGSEAICETWDGVQDALVQWQRGEVALSKGDRAGAIEADELAIQQLGKHVPQNRRELLLALTWQVFRQLAQRLLAAFVRRRSPVGENGDLLATRYYGRVSCTYWQEGDRLRSLWAHLCELNLVEQYEPTCELAHPYANHALLMLWHGWKGRGMRYVEAALAACQLTDCGPLAQALLVHGEMLYAATKYTDAIESIRRSAELYENLGDVGNAAAARCQLARTYFRLGRVPDAIAEAQQVVNARLDKDNAHIKARSLAVWALAAEDVTLEKTLRIELASTWDDSQTEVELRTALGVLLLANNAVEEAVETLRQGCAIAHQGRLFLEMTLPCRLHFAEALFALASTDPYADVRELRRETKTCLRLARRCRTYLPHALRQAAIVALTFDRRERARQLFNASLDEANAQHNLLEYAKTLEARGKVGKPLGWEESGDDFADGRYIRQMLRTAAPMSVIREASRLYGLDP